MNDDQMNKCSTNWTAFWILKDTVTFFKYLFLLEICSETYLNNTQSYF